jgi:hypothetical protein
MIGGYRSILNPVGLLRETRHHGYPDKARLQRNKTKRGSRISSARTNDCLLCRSGLQQTQRHILHSRGAYKHGDGALVRLYALANQGPGDASWPMTKVPMDRLTGLGTSDILSFPRFPEYCNLLCFTIGPLDFI